MKKEEFLKQIKLMFLDSVKFFKSVDSENKYGQLILKLALFYLGFVFLASILNLIVGVILYGAIQPIIILVWLQSLVYLTITSTLVLFAFLFLISGVLYLVLKMFRINKVFLSSFKPAVYSIILWIAYSYVLLIIGIIIQFVLPFNTSSLETLQYTTDWNSFFNLIVSYFQQPGALIMFVLGVIQLAHFVVFFTKYISFKFKLKMGKSYLISLISLIASILIAGGVWLANFFLNSYVTNPLN